MQQYLVIIGLIAANVGFLTLLFYRPKDILPSSYDSLKWLAALAASVQRELDRTSQTLTSRIRQLAERYDSPVPDLAAELALLTNKVQQHLKKMGAVWK